MKRMLPIVVALTLACAASASAATTSISTFSKTGRDPVTGSVATAGGPARTTATGHTIDWVLSYLNRTSGVANVTLTDPIAGNQTFVPGSLRLPPGFAGRWSTNGGASYGTSEPAGGVNAVGAVGQSILGSTGKEGATQPGPAAFQSTNAGGDGYEALFVGNLIYNVHHHSSGTVLDCHDRTGVRCSGYPTSVSGIAGQPFGTDGQPLTTSQLPEADVVGTRIYYPAGVIGSTALGVACADVATRTSCGFTQLGTGAGVQGTGGTWVMGGATIGSKYYLVGVHAEILCFDTATQAACPGYPLTNVADPGSGNFLYPYYHLQAWDGRYLFGVVHRANAHGDIICIDTTTNTRCPGFPKVDYGHVASGSSYGTALVPILNAAGAVTGICGPTAPSNNSHPYACFDLAGNAVPTPFSTTQVANTGVNWDNFGSIAVIGPRIYFAESTAGGVATYTCWDYSTSSACAGFVPASSGQNIRAYTLRQDPVNPDCIWEEGDADRFEVFSATFGGTNCSQATTNVDIRPSSFYCDGQAGHVTGWDRIQISGVTPADFTAMAVSIVDDNGDPVPGWTSRVFPNTTTSIDISSIPVTGPTGHLTITMSFAGLAANKTATVRALFLGDPAQVCFKTTVGAPQCATVTAITDTATAVTDAGAAGSDAPGGNGSGTVRFDQPPDAAVCRADLALVKSARGGPAVAGEDLSFDLRVTNDGPDAAQNVVVSDPLPADLTYVSATSGCGEAGGVVTCTLGSLGAGQSHTFTVTGKVASSLRHCLSNSASVSSATVDPDHANDGSTSCAPIEGRNDLRITKTPSRKVLPVGGGQVMYTLVVDNTGPSDATGVKVTDPMAAGLTLIAADPSQGSCSTAGGKLSCDLGDLVAGGSAQVLVTAQTWGTPGAIANTATVSGDQRETDPDNNTASATVTVPPPSPVASLAPTFDLAVTKTANDRTVTVGQRVTYTVVVANKGPAAAPSADLTDTLSWPASLLSVKPSQGSCARSIPMHCSVGTIPAGGKVTITVVTAPKEAGCRQRNAASASAEGTDANPANNLDAVDLCARQVALRLSKVADAPTVRAGGLMSYTIRVTNPTRGTARNVKTCDRLPAGLVYVSSRSKAKLAGGAYCWTAKSLAAGASRRYRITVRVLRGASGSRVNRATVDGVEARPRKARAAIRVLPVRAQGGGVTG
jgi:uncharacterized repeat protein (TIGR01451 family)